MTPNISTVETMLRRGGVWRYRDLQQEAMDITGDGEKRIRIGGSLRPIIFHWPPPAQF